VGWTLAQALATCVLCLVLGLPMAWVLARLEFRGRLWWQRALMLPFVVPTLVAALRSADNAQVNRAAEALGRLGVPSAVGPLVDALETQHVVVSGDGKPEGSTSATFTPSGGGLSMGGGPKRSTMSVRNDRVLEALVALTGTNFEWDARGWRVWLATRHAPPADYDPRRG
jgi:hypothetical protein